jgi:hypothetical protein
MHAAIELVSRHILGSDGLRAGPVAGQRIGQSEVLANAGIGAFGTSGGTEHRNGVGRPAGERQREAVVGWIDRSAARFKRGDRFGVFALSDLGEGNL